MEPGFEAHVQAFWEKNRNFILLACVAVLLAIAGREGWQYFSALRENGVREEYAKVSDQPERLIAFAEANSGHPLAAVAYLQVADQKFGAADYKQAAALYTKAAGGLKNEVLLGRAKLGAAISQISGGEKAAGESALKALGSDPSLLKAVRAEATYHLASLAYEAGNTEEVKKLLGEITKIELNGAWAQRATMLLASLQAGGKATDAPAGGLNFKPGGE